MVQINRGQSSVRGQWLWCLVCLLLTGPSLGLEVWGPHASAFAQGVIDPFDQDLPSPGSTAPENQPLPGAPGTPIGEPDPFDESAFPPDLPPATSPSPAPATNPATDAPARPAPQPVPTTNRPPGGRNAGSRDPGDMNPLSDGAGTEPLPGDPTVPGNPGDPFDPMELGDPDNVTDPRRPGNERPSGVRPGGARPAVDPRSPVDPRDATDPMSLGDPNHVAPPRNPPTPRNPAAPRIPANSGNPVDPTPEVVVNNPLEPTGVPVASTPSGVRGTSDQFISWMIESSGVFGFLILICLLILVALVFLDFLQLQRELFLPPELIEDFERRLDAKEYQAAYELARGSDSFIGRVLSAGMNRLPRGYVAAEQAMQQVGDDETLAMEHKIGYLSLIAVLTPMLGLLGTVQGMLLTFQEIAASTATPKTYQLADGVATALFTTLEGLCVSIPAMIFYTLFRNRLARFVMEAGFVANQLMSRFQGLSQPGVNLVAPPAGLPPGTLS